jgi:hypothetical protein
MVAAFSSACGRRKPVELDPGRASRTAGRKVMLETQKWMKINGLVQGKIYRKQGIVTPKYRGSYGFLQIFP